jgi:PIN domain nuclease of toxin-antitoxin system
MPAVRNAVLDASAALAVVRDEPGADVVEEVLLQGDCSLCVVNWIEVAQRATALGLDPDPYLDMLMQAGVRFEPLILADADRAAALHAPTKHAGLSLADRCCLALAARLECPAYTADAAWNRLGDGVPVDVRLIR